MKHASKIDVDALKNHDVLHQAVWLHCRMTANKLPDHDRALPDFLTELSNDSILSLLVELQTKISSGVFPNSRKNMIDKTISSYTKC